VQVEEPGGWGRRVATALLHALRDYGILFAFGALFIALAVASDPFLTKANLLNILDQNAGIGIIACGGTLVIIAGGFDLSVGAIFAFAGVIAAKVAESGSPVMGLVVGVLTGVGLGLVNGAALSTFRVNSFIGTLATSYIFRGAATIITGAAVISVTEPSFSDVGSGSFLDVTYTSWIFFAVVLASGFLLQRTRFGRAVFAAGGNEEAARFSGIRVQQIRMLTFVLSGLCAGIAGVLSASKVATAQAEAGLGLELSAIAAIVVGGTAITGGRGAIWRTVVGVFFIALISNGFNLLGVASFYQPIALGVIIFAAVGLDGWSRR
jgi:ribose transport system permease protein